MTPQEESFNAFLDRDIGPLPLEDGEPLILDEQGRAVRRRVEDDVTADRALRELDHLDADDLADQRYLFGEQDQLSRWFRERGAPRERRRAFLNGMLHEYYEYLKTIGKVYKPKRRKSHTPYKLPHGTLEAYVVHEDFQVIPGQEAAFLAWCDARGFTKVTTTVEPRWGDVKKTFAVGDDGQVWSPLVVDDSLATHAVVPGVQVTRVAHEGFRVKHPGDPATEDIEGE